jgi:hypothetical protein
MVMLAAPIHSLSPTVSHGKEEGIKTDPKAAVMSSLD